MDETLNIEAARLGREAEKLWNSKIYQTIYGGLLDHVNTIILECDITDRATYWKYKQLRTLVLLEQKIINDYIYNGQVSQQHLELIDTEGEDSDAASAFA